MGPEIVEITIRVPEDRLGDLYRFLGTLYRVDGAEPATSADGQVALPWNPATDLDKARELLIASGPNPRRFLDFLADHGGQGFEGADIARHLGWETAQQVAGMTGGTGILLARLRRIAPWWSYTGGGTYGMSKEIAELFRRARP